VTMFWRRPFVVVMNAFGHDGSSTSGCVKRRLVVSSGGPFRYLSMETS
jgi:hypothetical protein